MVLFRWTPVNGGLGGRGGADGKEPAASGRRRYVPVRLPFFMDLSSMFDFRARVG